MQSFAAATALLIGMQMLNNINKGIIDRRVMRLGAATEGTLREEVFV